MMARSCKRLVSEGTTKTVSLEELVKERKKAHLNKKNTRAK
jgi:hypothetical protein